MMGNKDRLGKKNHWMVSGLGLLLLILPCFIIAQSNGKKEQKEIDEYGAELDATIFRRYQYLEAYAKKLIDDEIQSVPYRIHIVQPKRDYMPEDSSEVRTDGNTVEIIQHGYVYSDVKISPEPHGRYYRTLKLRFSGQEEERKLAELWVEIYRKNFNERTFYWVQIHDSSPQTNPDIENQPDQDGFTILDKSIQISRRSNSQDADQFKLEMEMARQSQDQNEKKIRVQKPLSDIKNTPALPLRNQFKNDFYRHHLAYFSNVVFIIVEMHINRDKSSDNYMLEFLRDSTEF